MTTERYTILRKSRHGANASGASSLDHAGQNDGVSLMTQELDEKTAAEIRADPDHQIARGMATKLIKPLAGKPAAGVPAWGLDAVGATTSPMTGEGVVVAVLDTGIEAGHEAFAKVSLRQKDFSGDGDGDRCGHGTHCAGTIFGGEVAGRRIGVAPGVRSALIGKILNDRGAGDAIMMFDGIRWALAQGVDVISMSVGFDFPGQVKKKVDLGWEPEIATSEALDAFRENLDMLNALMSEITANKAYGKSPLVVAASGNESKRATDPDWRVSASLPASAIHLSVAALELGPKGLTVASFSNSKAAIAAPGVDIVSANFKGGLIADSGTSMACPFVAGVAALWAQKLMADGDPATGRTLESYIIANASRNDLVDCDIVDVGRGLVRAPQ